MMNIPHLQKNVPLAPYTTFKIGGPATYFVAIQNKVDMLHALKEAAEAGIDWVVLGGGSNMLIANAGFDGLVIKSEIREVEIDKAKEQARLSSGLLMAGAIQKTATEGLAGLEYAIGVPATIGGAIWANLGARGSELQDFLIETTVITPEGHVEVIPVEACEYGYRESRFKHEKSIILDGLFQLRSEDSATLKKRIKELSQLRTETQDISAQCAGCIFRNPTDQTTEAAAKLIDDLDLKGTRIGGAQVSDIHANFIINTGDATAEDVITLISLIKQKVRDSKGVQLTEEVEYIGL